VPLLAHLIAEQMLKHLLEPALLVSTDGGQPSVGVSKEVFMFSLFKKVKEMFSGAKKSVIGLLATLMCLFPSLAFADSSIRVSGYLGVFILIVVIAILAGVALWAIGYWTAEISKISPVLVKIMRFIVIAIALVWILLLIVGLFGVHVT